MRFFSSFMAGAAAFLLGMTIAGNAPAAPQAETFAASETLAACDGGARYLSPPAKGLLPQAPAPPPPTPITAVSSGSQARVSVA